MNRTFKKAIVILACIFMLAKNGLAQPWGYWGHMGPGMMDWGYGGGWIWSIIMLAFWIAVIVGIFFLIRWLVASTGVGRARAEESALEILKRRYAQGEIDKQEYEEKKKDLT